MVEEFVIGLGRLLGFGCRHKVFIGSETRNWTDDFFWGNQKRAEDI